MEGVFRDASSPKRNGSDNVWKFPQHFPFNGQSLKFAGKAKFPRIVTPESKKNGSGSKWALSPTWSNEEDTSPLLGNTPVKKNKQKSKKKFISPMKKKNMYKSPVKENSFYKSSPKEQLLTEEKSVYKTILSALPIVEESHHSPVRNIVPNRLDLSHVKLDNEIPRVITAETKISCDDADTVTTLSTQISDLGFRDVTNAKSFDLDLDSNSSEKVDAPTSVKSFHNITQNLLKKGMLVQTAKMLTDESFIEKRIRTVGIERGAGLHVNDCDLFQKKVRREQKRPKDSFTFCSTVIGDYSHCSTPPQANVDTSPGPNVVEEEVVEPKDCPNTSTWKDSEEIPCLPIESTDDMDTFNSNSCSNSQLYSHSNSSTHLSRISLISVDSLDVKQITTKAFSKYRKSIMKGLDKSNINDELNLPTLRHIEKALFTFGKSMRENNWYHEAMSMYRASLSVRIRIHKVKIPAEEDHIAMAKTLIEIGDIEEARLKLDKALNVFENVLTHLNNCTNRDGKVEAARTHNRIGDIHGSRNDLAKALQSYQQALKIQKLELGENHWNVAETLHNIGVVHRHNENLDLALEVYQEALDILKSVGVESLAVARTYNNIGSVHRRKGEFETAMSFFVEALKIRRKLVGDFHPSVDLTLIHYAMALRLQGDMNEAMKFYDECMK